MNERHLCNTDLHIQRSATRNGMRGQEMRKQTQPWQHKSTQSQACHAKWVAGKNNWKSKPSHCNTDLHTQKPRTRNGSRMKEMETQTQPLRHRSKHSKACHAKWLAGKLEKSTQPLQHRSAHSKSCHTKWLAGKQMEN